MNSSLPNHLTPANFYGYNDESEPLNPKKEYTRDEALEKAAQDTTSGVLVDCVIHELSSREALISALIEKVLSDGANATVGEEIKNIIEKECIDLVRMDLL